MCVCVRKYIYTRACRLTCCPQAPLTAQIRLLSLSYLFVAPVHHTPAHKQRNTFRRQILYGLRCHTLFAQG